MKVSLTKAVEVGEEKLVAVDVSGKELMLTRQSGRLHALGRKCPHAGADLAEEGIVCDRFVVCPWHKSRFLLESGALVDPPAVDALPHFDVSEHDGGAIEVELPDEEAKSANAKSESAKKTDTRCFAIIGAGAAGALAAQTLRERGFEGRIVMLDTQGRVPYDRTILSKYELSGSGDGEEKTPLQKQSFYDAHAIERIADEVTSLDGERRELRTKAGLTLAYDAALVATGGAPLRPEIPGADHKRVFTLRSREDAERIIARAERSRRVVVIGAGFVGMEAAASLRERGLEVTVVAPQKEPFEKQLGAKVGGVFRKLHERKGVQLRFESKAKSIEGGGDEGPLTVALEDGSALETDFVLIGVGVRPVTELVRGVKKAKDGGIEVDARLRAVTGLFVAGDAAAFPLRGDGERVRVEHWRVAQQQGRLAAANMLGEAREYESVPYFWTIQFGQRLDYVGHATSWDAVDIDGDLDKPDFVARYRAKDRVIAAAGWSRDEEMVRLLLQMEKE